MFSDQLPRVPSVKTIRIYESEADEGSEERDLWRITAGRVNTGTLSKDCSQVRF